MHRTHHLAGANTGGTAVSLPCSRPVPARTRSITEAHTSISPAQGPLQPCRNLSASAGGQCHPARALKAPVANYAGVGGAVRPAVIKSFAEGKSENDERALLDK